jgi:hypothetical protein
MLTIFRYGDFQMDIHILIQITPWEGISADIMEGNITMGKKKWNERRKK